MDTVVRPLRHVAPVVLSLAVFLVGPAQLSAQGLTTPVDSTASVIHYTGDARMHNWTGTSRSVSGMFALTPETPQSSRAVVQAPVASFKSGRDRRDRKMREVTEAKKYPTVEYKTTEIQPIEWQKTSEGYAGRWDLEGDLTFHGRTKPVEARAQVQITSDSVFVDAQFSVSLTRFGVERPKLMWVDPIGDTIKIDAHVVGAVNEPSTADQRLERSRSELTGMTQLASAELRSLPAERYAGNTLRLRAEARYRDDDPEEWSLLFYGFTKQDPTLINAGSVAIHTSGETLVPTKVERKTRSLDNGATVEIVEAVLSRSSFTTVAQTLTASVRIGETDFPLPWSTRRDLRRILEAVPVSSSEQVSSANGN